LSNKKTGGKMKKKIAFWSCLIIFIGICLFVEWAVNGFSDLPYLSKRIGDEVELQTDGGDTTIRQRMRSGAASSAIIGYEVFNEKHSK
jgi:hypothetical protein